MKAHIRISHKEGKSEGREDMCARTVNGSEHLSLRYIDIF